MLSVQTPCYADTVNYLACGIKPYEFSNQLKRKLRADRRLYIWDDSLLLRREADMIIRGCVPETKQGEIIDKCHASPYGFCRRLSGMEILHTVICVLIERC